MPVPLDNLAAHLHPGYECEYAQLARANVKRAPIPRRRPNLETNLEWQRAPRPFGFGQVAMLPAPACSSLAIGLIASDFFAKRPD